MGFGIDVKVKVEAPKLSVPKVDVGAAVGGAVSSAKAAVSGAVAGATNAAATAVSAATAAVSGAVTAATGAASAALGSVAGAIADVAASFTGAIDDLVLEPHLQLSANASYGKTEFKKGPIWIRVEMPPAEARVSQGKLRLFSASGSYDQEKPLREYSDESASTIACLFEEAPMNETYSLEIISDSGDKTLVFSGVPYGHMRKSGQEFLE
jgi:hypothetical protein